VKIVNKRKQRPKIKTVRRKGRKRGEHKKEKRGNIKHIGQKKR
jgi:hypothetical protein